MWNPYHLPDPTVLGAAPSGILGTRQDPIYNYGQRTSSAILSVVAKQPQARRKAVLKEVLDVLDPSLYARVAEKAERISRERGVPMSQAIRQALAVSMANGLSNEMIRRATGQPVATGYADLGGLTDFFKGVGKSVKGAARTVARKATSAGKKLSAGAKTALDFAGKAACVAMNSGLADAALQAGAAYATGGTSLMLTVPGQGGQTKVGEASPEQIGGMAAKIGKSLCKQGAASATTPAEDAAAAAAAATETSSGSAMPLVIGGGALAALALLL